MNAWSFATHTSMSNGSPSPTSKSIDTENNTIPNRSAVPIAPSSFMSPSQYPVPDANYTANTFGAPPPFSSPHQDQIPPPHQQQQQQQQQQQLPLVQPLRRPSTLDSFNIWGASNTSSQSRSGSISNPSSIPNSRSHSESIWSTHELPQFATNVPPFTAPGLASNHALTNRKSLNGVVNYSPKVSPQFSELNPFDMPNATQFEIDLRRNSFGDAYNYRKQQQQQQHQYPHQQLQQFQQPPQQQQQHQGLHNHPPQPTFLPPHSNMASQQTQPSVNNTTTLESIEQYFGTDPHERVKVTADFLQSRFFDEEKFLGDAFQLPRFPVENSLRNYQLVIVGFKAGRIDVFYLPTNNPDLAKLQAGDLVIVEADRGRDLGKILRLNISIDEARLMKLLQFQEQQAALHEFSGGGMNDLSATKAAPPPSGGNSKAAGNNAPPTLHFPKSILALAQPHEVVQILNKKQDEEKACRLCLAKIANTANLLGNNNDTTSGNGAGTGASDLMQMKLIDAEYQFDRKKLIFYYSTNRRIDFRDLVRELFRIYKTRIWMCAVTGIPYIASHNQQTSVQPNSRQNSIGSFHQVSPPPTTNGGRFSQSYLFSQQQPQHAKQSANGQPQVQLNNPFKPRAQSLQFTPTGFGQALAPNVNMLQPQSQPPYLPQGSMAAPNGPNIEQLNASIMHQIPRKLPSDQAFVHGNGGSSSSPAQQASDTQPDDDDDRTVKGGESFMLQSLVDSINY